MNGGMRRQPCRSCRNMRDLGGYPVKGGGAVIWGRFLRSDAPLALTEEETARLLRMGVTTVIDLRYPEEAAAKPCCLADRKGFSCFSCSIGGGWVPASEEEIPASYCSFLEEHAAMKKVFRIMAEADAGVLFHCSAGKDRTGVVAALLLSLAGAEDCDILADYSVSDIYIRQTVRQLRLDDPSLPMFAGRSKAEYLEKFLAMFREKYTDVASYLLRTGLEKDAVERLKRRLTDHTER